MCSPESSCLLKVNFLISLLALVLSSKKEKRTDEFLNQEESNENVHTFGDISVLLPVPSSQLPGS